MPSSSWFSLVVSLEDTKEIAFNGCFSVNDINKITGMYETIDGKTDFTNNLLLSDFGLYLDDTIYKGYQVYTSNTYRTYNDTIYEKEWLQFDRYGVIVSNLTKYKDGQIVKFRAKKDGEETETNLGYVYIYQNENPSPDVFLASYTIDQIADPTDITYWYTLGITLNDEVKTSLFQGFFSTYFTQELKGFYETINGTTDFSNNLLIFNLRQTEVSNKGFGVYAYPTNTAGGNFIFDNAYQPSDLQFDYYGAFTNGISYYNDAKVINWYAINYGDETITNVGGLTILNNDGISVDVEVIYTIKPTSSPI